MKIFILMFITEELNEVGVPEIFPFPFEPYSIQKDFMKVLYTCLQSGKVGIFESPTGTVSKGLRIFKSSSECI